MYMFYIYDIYNMFVVVMCVYVCICVSTCTVYILYTHICMYRLPFAAQLVKNPPIVWETWF